MSDVAKNLAASMMLAAVVGGSGHLFRVDGAHSLRVWWSSQGQSGPPDHTPLPNSQGVRWTEHRGAAAVPMLVDFSSAD